MHNPFYIYWNKIDLSNSSFGRCYLYRCKRIGGLIRKPLLATESPFAAAIIYNEDKNRKSLFNSWKSKKNNSFN